MAITTRQTAIFGVEDWKQLYQTYREADFQSYDFETLRKSFVDYLRLYYPETFNDYIESSEFIALLDVMAFMGQSLAFRADLNARENYIDTAERRDSVVRLANLVSYTAKRNSPAEGLLKVTSVTTTENVLDYNGVNLSNITVNWNDPTNGDWFEQFITIVNSALVDTQRFGRPGADQNLLGIDTQEYTLNITPGYLPVIPFTATVDGINMPFEAVSVTSAGREYLYEPSPRPNGAFNMLYRNDQLGFGSQNSGFFFYFKQGNLLSADFNLPERVTNRVVNVNIEGINNEDRWLYQLDDIGSVSEEWQYVESVYTAAAEQDVGTLRKIYSTVSRVNDQISLTFGDGVFSAIPVGTFRAYVRSSNGLEYVINPSEMATIALPINYVSRTGRIETITFTVGLTAPVSNSQSRELLDEIKQRAPARYYTQNRMVNGEDYNLFPFTLYNSIIKSKAVNRSAIGTSRYLELVDNTNKYASTNVFGSDGGLYKENTLPTFQFSWFTVNDIADAITNKVQPGLKTPGVLQFYYANFIRPSLSALSLSWNQSTALTNQCTGFFVDNNNDPVSIGSFSSSNAKYIVPASLVKFEAPDGFYFNQYNRLISGLPTVDTDKTVIWTTVTAVVLDGTNQGRGNLDDGTGPVAFNTFVPTGAVATQVIPIFITDLPTALVVNVIEQIRLYRNFGLGFNNLTGEWYLIGQSNLDADSAFSLVNQQNTSGANLDSSWLVRFTTDGTQYNVSTRELSYFFASVLQTRFFFESGSAIYDSRLGTVIKDFIKVLKSNSLPDSNSPLPSDVEMQIIGQPEESDGFVNDFQVIVSFTDSDQDGSADNPDFFEEIVGPDPAPTQAGNLVFLEATVDFNDLQRYLLVEEGRVNYQYGTYAEVETYKSQYLDGQVFYTYLEKEFWRLVIDVTGTRTLVQSNEFLARIGRQNLYYQYRHNSLLSNRIDPSITNIIDVYVVTQDYYIAYQNYIKDSTGTVPEPAQPTINELTTQFQRLQDYKMLSDNVILNSVTFKPLFGNKATTDLRATIKVIKAANSTASVSEIKNAVVQSLNDYFTIDKWNFGDTFYFSELSAYIHKEIGTLVSSVVLVPVNPQKAFGDLYEIRSAPNEIFVNAATVADVEVIDALTSTNLRTAPGSGVI
jgi:hypothetical protein